MSAPSTSLDNREQVRPTVSGQLSSSVSAEVPGKLHGSLHGVMEHSLSHVRRQASERQWTALDVHTLRHKVASNPFIVVFVLSHQSPPLNLMSSLAPTLHEVLHVISQLEGRDGHAHCSLHSRSHHLTMHHLKPETTLSTASSQIHTSEFQCRPRGVAWVLVNCWALLNGHGSFFTCDHMTPRMHHHDTCSSLGVC